MTVLDAIYLLFAAVFGLCLGSFATALSWRLPRGISIVSEKKTRNKKQAAVSRCTHCKHELTLADLIPLFSWLCTLGRCRHCKKNISIRYPLIELSTAALCVAAWVLWGWSASTLLMVVAAPVLVAIVAIDLEHYIIPDELNLVLALLALAGIAGQGPSFSPVLAAGQDALLGGAIAFACFYLLRWVFLKAMKKEALGFGDVKLFGVMGLWLQLGAFPSFLLIAGASGVLLSLIWKPLTGSKEFPFGPSLILAFLASLYTGHGIFL